jgi:hypothetical protein
MRSKNRAQLRPITLKERALGLPEELHLFEATICALLFRETPSQVVALVSQAPVDTNQQLPTTRCTFETMI